MYYKVIKNLISVADANYFTKIFREKLIDIAYDDSNKVGDNLTDVTRSIYSHPVFDSLLYSLNSNISKEFNKELIHTYSFVRMYKKGSYLKVHKDRPSCEYSITLHLGASSTEPWPIYFKDPITKRQIEVNMEPGDCALYKGCEISHWRETCNHDWYLQVFLHYVDKNGQYASYANDQVVRDKQRQR